MNFSVMINSLLMIFLMMLTGFLAGKINLVSNKAGAEFNKVVLNITMPCTIFSSMVREMDNSLLRDTVIIFILGFVIFGGLLLIMPRLAVLFHVPKEKVPVWTVSSSLCNSGFMGFPLAYAVFGSDGLFLAAIMNISYNLVAFTLGIRTMCMNSRGSSQFRWKSLLVMPVNIAVFIGMIFFLGQWTPPALVMDVINDFAGITTPFSMFLIGLSLSRGRISDTLRDREVFTAALMRLILIPAAVLLFMKLLPWRGDTLLVGITVLILAMPSPTLALIFAQQYGEDTTLASRIIAFTSFACLITIPLIMLLAV